MNTVDIENFPGNLSDECDGENFKHLPECDLQGALNHLPEKYKTPLLLYYFSDISYKEMSHMLTIPIGTVMSRIARAKMFLRKFINENAGNNGSNVIQYNFKKGIS